MQTKRFEKKLEKHHARKVKRKTGSKKSDQQKSLSPRTHRHSLRTQSAASPACAGSPDSASEVAPSVVAAGVSSPTRRLHSTCHRPRFRPAGAAARLPSASCSRTRHRSKPSSTVPCCPGTRCSGSRSDCWRRGRLSESSTVRPLRRVLKRASPLKSLNLTLFNHLPTVQPSRMIIPSGSRSPFRSK